MDVSDQELRALVREAIARHAGDTAGALALSLSKGPLPFNGAHMSHGRFLQLTPSEDGQCVIEPAVRCSHCGYCQSYGH